MGHASLLRTRPESFEPGRFSRFVCVHQAPAVHRGGRKRGFVGFGVMQILKAGPTA